MKSVTLYIGNPTTLKHTHNFHTPLYAPLGEKKSSMHTHTHTPTYKKILHNQMLPQDSI